MIAYFIRPYNFASKKISNFIFYIKLGGNMFFKEKCRCKNKEKSASSKKPPLHTPKLNPLNFEIFKRSS